MSIHPVLQSGGELSLGGEPGIESPSDQSTSLKTDRLLMLDDIHIWSRFLLGCEASRGLALFELVAVFKTGRQTFSGTAVAEIDSHSTVRMWESHILPTLGTDRLRTENRVSHRSTMSSLSEHTHQFRQMMISDTSNLSSRCTSRIHTQSSPTVER